MPANRSTPTCGIAHDETARDERMDFTTAILVAVGFDPNRKHNTTTFDYVLVVIALAVAIGLTLWAFLG